MTKNIVVFSDGTGQEGGEGNNTNVYKLFNMLENRTDRQITFYDRGLGTGWRKISGNVGGMGISKNILECYEFIFDHFCAGDRIYLFGFSRGATTVRSLSGFMHHFGILPKSRPELIDKAYTIYKIRPKKENKEGLKKWQGKVDDFIEANSTMYTKIEFIGVWDTVAALGLPFQPLDAILNEIPGFAHKFHDLRLSQGVKHARHALAIDDQRLTFHPTLWDKDIEIDQSMKQVWFCGMHTDVGGGYKKHNLSDITLEWMMREATDKGLLIYRDFPEKRDPDPNGHMHDSRGSFFTKLFRKKSRCWNSATHGKPVIHESVTQRTKNEKNNENPKYDPWILKMDYDIEQ
ncbi:MAG: DUF2235 domain-containing protein [Nitrospinota bacterium]|nr:DUF2235 domain-containing protein [Nitrospinota bacterium]